ncbi:2-oxo acid dehydrogenase subunit E2 [[Mycoplasma] testudinis]|uniref:2-oxo acid dehydrogenase subunit E2 n=1 Tax=[Mycoplasma] testudinis TaxID=33924 RepID=UPI000695D871|nr:2-oxo acid dehydrogenase subunit E2 [[Mycoplasma] testudinis]
MSTEIKINPGDTLLEVSTIRGAIAKQMNVAKAEIPFTTLTFYMDVTNLVNYRKQVKDEIMNRHNLKLSFLPFLVKAVIYGIEKYPIFNASYEKEANKIHLKKEINFGIAVDTENGLMVPNIKNAGALSIVEIGHKIGELAKKARDKKLGLTDIRGGTISLTNFGSIGAAFGVPIINFPEVCIVAPGNIEEHVSKNAEGKYIVKQFMPITIAADHRWIDGADIGRFAKVLAEHLTTLDGLKVA